MTEQNPCPVCGGDGYSHKDGCLEEAAQRLDSEDWTDSADSVRAMMQDNARFRNALVTLLDRMDAVRDIARAALNGEDTRPHD